MRSRLALLLLLPWLAACGLPQVSADFDGLPPDLDQRSFACCHDPEQFYPPAFTTLALTFGQAILAKMPYPDSVPGLLVDQPGALEAVLDRAQPFDLLLTANKTYPGGRLVPGRFTHSSVYIGTEAQLRAIGLWNSPAIRPIQDDIRAGRTFVEAIRPVVRMSTPEALLQSDAVALLRPQLSFRQKQQALTVLVDKLGTPFDFWFDNNTPDVLSCTELIGMAMPSLDFTIRSPYGRPAAMPDDVVAQAIRGERMRFIEQVRGLKGGGFVVEGADGAMRDIAAFWGPPYQEN